MYELARDMPPLRLQHEPTHEVWGGYLNGHGECDDPRHLEDCFSLGEANDAAIEWASAGRYAFVRAKGEA